MVGVALCGAILLGTAAPAAAAPTTEVVQGQYLRIVSTADWDAARNLHTVAAVPWELTISAAAPAPGTMTLGVSAMGGTPLIVDVLMCAEAWNAGVCGPGASVLRAGWAVPRNGSRTDLTSVADTAVVHLRLVVALDAGTAATGTATALRVHAIGVGESVVVGAPVPAPEPAGDAGPGETPAVVGDGALPITGQAGNSGLLYAGFGALLLGAALVLLVRREPKEAEA